MADDRNNLEILAAVSSHNCWPLEKVRKAIEDTMCQRLHASKFK